jgi:hypothetical protein
MSDYPEMEDRLLTTLHQLEVLEENFAKDLEENRLGDSVDPLKVHNGDGIPILLPVVVAKAHVLSALAPIRTKRLETEARKAFLAEMFPPKKPDVLCSICNEPLQYFEETDVTSEYWTHKNGLTRTTGTHAARP